MTKSILIAGASRGIGLEMARQASAAGDRVLAMVRSDAAERALDGIAAQVVRADVTDEAAVQAAADSVEGTVDVLVCNAGIYRGRGGIDAADAGADAWSAVLMTNVAGPFLVTRAFAPRITAPGGKIAIISSVMGSSARAAGNGYLYRASKAAATNLACNLAAGLRDRGIAVGSYH
ncbi:MAG: SDR family NAD(P)-dependent oxidoreductase, partial [Pseudomonadota bacterium]